MRTHKTKRKLLALGFITSFIVLVAVFALTTGTTTIQADPGETSACTSCHAYPAASLRVSTDVTAITVSPGASFDIGISWTGGSGRTEINWPNTMNNTQFSPSPRIPYSASSSSGNTSSTLTAPSATGTYTVRVFAAKKSPRESYYADVTVTVSAPTPPTISTTSLADGTVGTAYSQTLAAASGTTPYSWSLSTGSLPAGLSLNTSSGAITGIPTVAGTFSFTAMVTDAASGTDTQALSITVNPAPVPLSITTTSLPAGTVGTAYSQTLSATNGTTPYSWSLSAGSLPAGLSLNASSGAITGIPTASGTFSFTAMVTDAASETDTQPLSIAVNPASDTVGPVTTGALAVPNPTNGAASATLTANINDSTTGDSNIATAEYFVDFVDGDGTGITMSATDGSFNSPTESVTATVDVSGLSTGSHVLYVHGKDTVGNWGPGISVTLSITEPPLTPTITTIALSNGAVGTAYSQALAATGGTTPYSWSISAGSLPAGLSLNALTGEITGTPTAAGTSSFTAMVTDAASATATKVLSITINPAAEVLTITTTSLPDGTVGSTYSQTLAATGGTTPYSWSLSAGSLPAGLSLEASTGAITGTPTAAGTSSFTAMVTDAASATATKDLSITINPSSTTLRVTTTSLPAGTVSIAYSRNLSATGGTTPYSWSLSAGTLPAGLSLNASTGAITGTPTTAGTSSFTAMVTDAPLATATKSLSITINATISDDDEKDNEHDNIDDDDEIDNEHGNNGDDDEIDNEHGNNGDDDEIDNEHGNNSDDDERDNRHDERDNDDDNDDNNDSDRHERSDDRTIDRENNRERDNDRENGRSLSYSGASTATGAEVTSTTVTSLNQTTIVTLPVVNSKPSASSENKAAPTKVVTSSKTIENPAVVSAPPAKVTHGDSKQQPTAARAAENRSDKGHKD